MRVASYIGFFAMVFLGFGAFAWVNAWWATALLLLAALAVGWFSLGLYARGSAGSAWRALRGIATHEDVTELARLDDRARYEAFTRAASARDPQRDRLYRNHIEMMGGPSAAEELVIEHLASHGVAIDRDEARDILDEWRLFGIVQGESLGEYLDRAAMLAIRDTESS